MPNPSDTAASVPTETARLATARAAFLADFAAGRIGQNHNLYQHRARLIRQQAARLAR